MPLNYLFLNMEIAHLHYVGDFKCEIQHLSSGDCIRTDAPKDNNGSGLHTSPTDLLAMALASCMITVVAIKFKKRISKRPTQCYFKHYQNNAIGTASCFKN